MKLYPDQDHPALGDWYIRHVAAMTAEGLHAKSDIAAQLAWRDIEIARLQAQVAELAGIVGRYVAHDRASDEEMCTALCTSHLHRCAVHSLAKVGR